MDVERQDAYQENERCISAEKFTVFIHGVPISTKKDAQRSLITELEFLRMDDQILVARESESVSGSCTVTELRNHCLKLDSYGSECCWKVTEFGFQRYEVSDSEHGESQTRIVHSLEQVTCLNLAKNEIASNECSIFVRSCEPESPFITALSSSLQYLTALHQHGECVVNIKAMRNAFLDANIRVEDVILLYAMSGCCMSPSTQKITQQLYISAFLSLELDCSSLYSTEILKFPP